LSEEQTSKYKIQLVHDRKRTPRLYPNTPLEKGAQQIPENRSQRDHKTTKQQPAVNWRFSKPYHGTSDYPRKQSANSLVPSKNPLPIQKVPSPIQRSAATEEKRRSVRHVRRANEQ
jgi:hypothetical protein